MDFENKNLELRERNWSAIFPRDCPLATDVNFRLLAQQYENMTGGDIKNAVLRAATQAARPRRVNARFEAGM